MEPISINGAHENNLKGISLVIPGESLTVITGVSGSGKSSLAFDTLFREGQRRYLESLSAYARQFLGRMVRPAVDSIEGLSPAVSIDQKTAGRSNRSTVGTMTEVYDFLRLLFARLGTPHCPGCGVPVTSQTPEEITDRLIESRPGQLAFILAPVVQRRKGEYRKELEQYLADGFTRVRIDGKVVRLDRGDGGEAGPGMGGEPMRLDRYSNHTIELIMDRVVLGVQARSRIQEGVERALHHANGLVGVWLPEMDGSAGDGLGGREDDGSEGPGERGERGGRGGRVGMDQGESVGENLSFAASKACALCGFSLSEVEPRLFSFNTPWGWCERCKGLGKDCEPRVDQFIENGKLSIKAGALSPVNNSSLKNHNSRVFSMLAFKRLAAAIGFSLDTPWELLTEDVQYLILHGGSIKVGGAGAEGQTGAGAKGAGTGKRARDLAAAGVAAKAAQIVKFEGLIPTLQDLWRRYRFPYLEHWLEPCVCPDCGGARLSPAALSVRFRERSIAQVSAMTVDDLIKWLDGVDLAPGLEEKIGAPILRETMSRLHFLQEVGLGYLSLDRSGSTLAGGEAQRIRLASQVGSGLQGILYVLDEPSIGLHPRDNLRLINTLRKVRDAGNTVVVVEHDEETMRAADLLVDIGPGAGFAGGEITAAGTPEQVERLGLEWMERHGHGRGAGSGEAESGDEAALRSYTARFLSGLDSIPIPSERRRGNGLSLCIRGGCKNNLKDIDVTIPLGCMVVVTGVSGSGKSTMVDSILREGIQSVVGRRTDTSGILLGQPERDGFSSIEGVDYINKVVVIDQDPIGRTPRSNPATYVGVLTPIRDLFAELPAARVMGFSRSRFSFNVAGGRCANCDGAGVHRVGMEFLADVEVTCDVCNGTRFNEPTLQVTYKGRNIAQVLDMTVHDAVEFFSSQPKIHRMLQVMESVGLGYLKLGQSSTTLSGGEAQRIKLASELRKVATGNTLYILDEPTTGLHAADVGILLESLGRLVDAGNTVLIVEHNLDVIKCADHLIDLGPEGGAGGGTVVVSGTPEEVAAFGDSHTGAALRPLFLPDQFSTRHKLDSGEAGAMAEDGAFAREAASSASVIVAKAQLENPVGAGAPNKMRDIVIQGARRHNLKDVDVTIPGGSFTVISGVSGSGKSSLALDTIFSEGQRRYVESLSTYARRFLGRMDRAPVNSIKGLAPAVAVDQKTASRNPRSTVATVTEIQDHLRLLYSRVGIPHCPHCGKELKADSPVSGANRVREILACAGLDGEAKSGTLDIRVTAPNTSGQTLGQAAPQLLASGLVRVMVGDLEVRLSERIPADLASTKLFSVVTDRISSQAGLTIERLSEAIARAYSLSSGQAVITGLNWRHEGAAVREEPSGCHGGDCSDILLLTEQAACPEHQFALTMPYSSKAFSFNHHEGACTLCQGLGVVVGGGEVGADGVELDDYGDGDDGIEGEGEEDGEGGVAVLPVDGDGEDGERDGSSDGGGRGAVGSQTKMRRGRFFLSRQRRRGNLHQCPACHGHRLQPGPLAVTVAGRNLPGLTSLTVAEAHTLVQSISGELDHSQNAIAQDVLKELDNRLNFLLQVGLDYLTLDRSAATLSGGEAQRIRLASQMGSGLTGCIYVLDEPTVGLHPRDTHRLVGTLKRLKDLGNTVIVVEHDLNTIREADWLIDMGPGAGRNGGRVVACGTVEQVARDEESPTGMFLSGRRVISPLNGERQMDDKRGIRVHGARANNLKNVDAFFPWGAVTTVTGVSGSGKSSLVVEVLQKAATAHLKSKRKRRASAFYAEKISGMETLREVVVVDQAPIGRTPRSIPATYIDIMVPLRNIFASSREAKVRGYKPGRFSFNVKQGRCMACEGMGAVLVEMHFLSDVWVQCDVCKGKRYNRETLQVRYRGRNIYDVLHMDAEEALEFFRGRKVIERKLQPMVDVGLGYLKLDQGADTLSGGEAQRLKLAAQLGKNCGEGTLIIMDEPTTGLHPADVEKLVMIMHKLADQGAAVVVVEHNMDVIRCSDLIIDLGPEGGAGGGSVIDVATPDQLAANAPETGSSTGHYLAMELGVNK